MPQFCGSMATVDTYRFAPRNKEQQLLCGGEGLTSSHTPNVDWSSMNCKAPVVILLVVSHQILKLDIPWEEEEGFRFYMWWEGGSQDLNNGSENPCISILGSIHLILFQVALVRWEGLHKIHTAIYTVSESHILSHCDGFHAGFIATVNAEAFFYPLS